MYSLQGYSVNTRIAVQTTASCRRTGIRTAGTDDSAPDQFEFTPTDLGAPQVSDRLPPREGGMMPDNERVRIACCMWRKLNIQRERRRVEWAYQVAWRPAHDRPVHSELQVRYPRMSSVEAAPPSLKGARRAICSNRIVRTKGTGRGLTSSASDYKV